MAYVPHEITLTAFSRDAETGKLCVYDVLPTSFHFASHFARRLMKDREVCAISASNPLTPHKGALRFIR